MTDPYVLAESALASFLRTLKDGSGDTFFPADTERDAGWQVSDDDTVLGLGGEYFAIYRPGACPAVPISRGIKDYGWEVLLDLYVRYTYYKESWDKFKAYRYAVITLLDTNQSLGGTNGVHGVNFKSDDKPLYFRFNETPEKAKPNFIIQPTQVVITQRVIYLKGDL